VVLYQPVSQVNSPLTRTCTHPDIRPGYDKNWLWSGGNLWYERWQQIWQYEPEYVEIISWNDFGESHYIGPLDDRQYGAFDTGEAPFNYVAGLEHTGWALHLAWMIETYLTGKGRTISESALVSHHVTKLGACSEGGTTGNTASQLQLEFAPGDLSEDRLYIAALLTEPAGFSVNEKIIVDPKGWDIIPSGGVGLYYTSVPMDGESFLVIKSGHHLLMYAQGRVRSSSPSSAMANHCLCSAPKSRRRALLVAWPIGMRGSRQSRWNHPAVKCSTKSST
jgi:hypothetical protein